jgi:3-mercaptopyruvate sulfurtransferase SseA
LARILLNRGYSNVAALHGGFEEWVRRGLATTPKEISDSGFQIPDQQQGVGAA